MRICRGIAFSIAFSLACAFAQSNSTVAPAAPVNPVAPSPGINMPAMPSVSAPVSGSGFYRPGQNYLKDEKNSVKTSSSPDLPKSSASAILEQKLSEKNSLDFSGLTAQDLVQLAQSGSITNLSSLTGFGAKNIISADTNSNQILLKQILSELEEIKKMQSKTLVRATDGTKPSALPPKILRFMINANDILLKCSQVYFSDRETDGSFLLTGDTKTLVGKETVNETFYFLFKASGTQKSKTVYNVSTTLSQSREFETPLSRMCSEQKYIATKTGNLVTLHFIANGNTMDLLLDIGKTQ